MTQANNYPYNERFLEFIKLFAMIGKDSRLFPKKCHTCGKEFGSFSEYLQRTSPVEHGLEDYRDASDSFGAMQYRNCYCGSTLVINFTKDVYPLLDRFWEMIGIEARNRGKPVREVVADFREQCNHYIVEREET